ncbi:MAG: TRAP transporter large permease [Treponema sp.]|nr:TRAP transporter large permease [Treponema sp.]
MLDAQTVFLIVFPLLLLLIILRIPVSFALAFAVLPVLILTPALSPVLLLQRMMIQFGSFLLLAIPLFILAANIMNAAKITDRLMRLAQAFVGHLPGGLACVNVVLSKLFAPISASANADVAGSGSILIPAMVKEGYDVNFSVAVTACSAVMVAIIPPSITMIVWGGTLNVSVGGLFLAGIVPGLLIGVLAIGVCLIYAFKRKYPRRSTFSLREVWDSFRVAIPDLMTPVIIFGGIVGGIVTPTEAALIAVLYAMFLSMVVYRTVTIKIFLGEVLRTMRMASIVLFAVGTAAIYAWVVSFYQIPAFLVEQIRDVTTNPQLMLLIIVGVFIVVGLFLDAIPAIIIFAPLLQPLALAVGIHPLHFAIVGIISLAIGLVTPPYGLCLLIACRIGKIPMLQPYREVLSFLGVMFLVLFLTVLFPDLALAIPKFFMPEIFGIF